MLLASSAAGGPPRPPKPPGPKQAAGAVRDAAGAVVDKAREAADQAAGEAGRVDQAKARCQELESRMASEAQTMGLQLQVTLQREQQVMNAALTKARQERQSVARKLLDALRGMAPGKATKTVLSPRRVGTAQVPAAPVRRTGPLVRGGTAQGLAQVVPVLTQLNLTEGEPGDPILITGTGFTDATEVYFRIDMGAPRKATSTTWDSTRIAAVVPEATGVPDFTGAVFLRDGNAQSGLREFRFQARRKVIPFLATSLTDYRLWQNQHDHCTPRGSQILASHSGWLAGGRGDDTFFERLQLESGWVVERVALDLPGGPDNSGLLWGARIVESRPGTSSPYVKVHSFYSPWYMGVTGGVQYFLRIFLRGPEGVPYL